MSNPEPRCQDHAEFMAALQVLAKANAEKDVHMRSLTDKLEKIHTALTRNLVRAEYRDKRQAEMEIKIDDINRKIENGLRSEVRETRQLVDSLIDCIEKRKVASEKGVKGAMRRGGLWIVEKGTVIVLLLIAYILANMYFAKKTLIDIIGG